MTQAQFFESLSLRASKGPEREAVDSGFISFSPFQEACPAIFLLRALPAEGGVPYTRPSRIYVGLTARFTLGSTPVLRFGFVRFASGLVGIRTGLVPDFRIRTGFRTQEVE